MLGVPLGLFLIILTTETILGDDLPFLCPYKVPDGSPQPSKSGTEGGGLLPLISEEDLTNADGGVFGQYKAALAMVPCDAQALSVFTSPLIKMNNAVSVIFVYNKPIKELKRWLEEKFYASLYYNPLVNSVAKQCPEIGKGQKTPYEKRLSGDEILNILCEQNCERLKLETDQVFPKLPQDICAIVDCLKPKSIELCPDVCKQVRDSSLKIPTPGPIYHVSYHVPLNISIEKSYRPKRNINYAQNAASPNFNDINNVENDESINKAEPSDITQYSSSKSDTTPKYYIQKVLSMVSYEIKSGLIKQVKFDDAPQPVYGIAFRIRRHYSCDELEQGCGEFEDKGNVIDCDLPRFSACQGEWTDCVSEDEQYLQEKTTFYDECTLVSSGEDESLTNASDNTCSGPRRCRNGRSAEPGDQPFIGYDPFGNCTCPSETDSFPISDETGSKSRFKRQTGEGYQSAGGRSCRLLRTRKGSKKVVCDETVLIRTMRYLEALRVAKAENTRCEEISSDPASCSILGFDCEDTNSNCNIL